MFCSDYRKSESLRCAINGAQEQVPAWPQQPTTRRNNRVGRRDMLQHFQARHHVEINGVFFRQLFNRDTPIINLQVGFMQV